MKKISHTPRWLGGGMCESYMTTIWPAGGGGGGKINLKFVWWSQQLDIISLSGELQLAVQSFFVLIFYPIFNTMDLIFSYLDKNNQELLFRKSTF